MKLNLATLLTAVSMTALLVGGCASSEAVKKDAAAMPAVTAEKAEPAKPVAPVEQAKPAEPVKPIEQVRPVEQAIPVETAKAVVGISFETVYFDFDKSDLRQDARDVLSKNAEAIIKSMPGAKVQIAGHCDERGSAEYNLALGERRAQSVQKYLTTLGVAAENLSIISYGKEKPAVIGDDEAAWAKNRRAEFSMAK